MAKQPLLEIENIETRYGRSQVLFGISLTIAAGEMVSLMGRNGMGKTTTVRSVMGLTPAIAGAIRFDGTDICRLPPYRIAQHGIGLVPEGRQVFPNLTSRENLVATASNRRGVTDSWTLEKVEAMFPQLAERAATMGRQLSGGEQQMLAIGRALMTNPRLIILDEATEGLAPLIRDEIWRALGRSSRRPIDSGDRQERRDADRNCRPPLCHRTRSCHLVGNVTRACRRAGGPASISRNLGCFPIRLTLPVSLPGLTGQSSIHGRCLLDRPVKPGDDRIEGVKLIEKCSRAARHEIDR
jgi:branched-chain amino acid transport system ATP-binding protein